MSEIKKIEKYVDKHGVPRNKRYDISMKEAIAISREMSAIEAVSLAFVYGRAKGYRAAKAEVLRGQAD